MRSRVKRTDVVDSSTLRDVDSDDGPVVTSSKDAATPTIPCDAVDPDDAPAVPNEVDEEISGRVGPMRDRDPDEVDPQIS